MTTTCYKCEREVTSREHVPPKCVFPSKKDLPKNFSFRKNLITVPSCDIHNSHKSMDDEYLSFVLFSTDRGNKISFKMFETKMMRAFDRKPHVYRQFLSKSKKIHVWDTNGEKEETLGVTIDVVRFNRIAEQLASGLIYHHYSRKWISGSVVVLSNFLLDITTEGRDEFNRHIQETNAKIKNSVSSIISSGENEEIFKYKIISNEKDYAVVMNFYQGIQVSVALNSV